MTLLAERPPDEVDESELVVGRRIQEFSQLAGPIREPDPAEGAYRVAYRGVDAVHGRGRVARSLLVAGLNFAFEALFFLWLLHPSHRPPVFGSTFAIYANWVVIGSIGLMELLRLINVVLAVAGLGDRPRPDPGAARPATSASRSSPRSCPSKEPIDVVRGTLQAALRIRYDGHPRRLAPRRGRRRGRQGDVPRAGRPPLHPQGHREVQPAARARSRRRPSTATTTPGSTAHGDRYDVLPLGRPRPRAAAQLRRADPRLLPRPRRRLRRRPAVLRQRRDVRDPGGGVAAVPVPPRDPARGQPLRRRRCWSAPTTPSASAPCAASAASSTRSPRTWPPG